MTYEEHKLRMETDSYIKRRRAELTHSCGACSGSGFIDCGNSESGDVGYGWECRICGGSGRNAEPYKGQLYIGA